MTANPSPLIDLRNQTELAYQLRELVHCWCYNYWDTSEDIRSDKWSESLIQIYSRFMEILIQRINRVPDKNFLAFLNTMGVDLLPPKPAKTALTFTLAKGSPQYIKIPAATQAAAKESPDDQPVIFETVRDLTVIRPNLVRCASITPGDDKWKDHSSVLLATEVMGRQTLFEGKELIKHRIYFEHSRQFDFKEKKNIILITDLTGPSQLSSAAKSKSALKKVSEKLATDSLKKISSKRIPGAPSGLHLPIPLIIPSTRQLVKWYCFSEDSEAAVELVLSNQTDPKVANLMKGGELTFVDVAPIPEKEITGFTSRSGNSITRTGRWIYAELAAPVTEHVFPAIESVHCRVEDSDAGKKYQADLAFANKYAIDLSTEFYPFGQRPKLYDVFYLGSANVFAKDGADITIEVLFAQAGEPSTDTNNTENTGTEKTSTANTPELTWEYWRGDNWQIISGLTDTSNQFTDGPADSPRTITFTCPLIKFREINGKENFWIRVRLSAGDYGKDVEYEPMDVVLGNQTISVWSVTAAESFKPPIIKSLNLSFTPEQKGKPIQKVITYNHFLYEEHLSLTNGVIPFTTEPDDGQRAFYLAFDEDISKLPVTLFFPMEAEAFSASVSEAESPPPRLEWECWNGSQWVSLSVEDETGELTGRGMVELLVPENTRPAACFGEKYHWIRSRLVDGKFPADPQLTGIFINSVWAQNKVTVTQELLGSGNGSPSQQLSFSNKPVLSGQEILIREAELVAEEKEQIEKEEGADAFEEIDPAKTSGNEIWVRWHEVKHFWFSNPNSRHYVIDREKGTITFGDGKRGMIPQAGRNNIQARLYRYGGGIRGNLQAAQLIKMRKAIPYVESVSNPVSCEGGTDVESLAQVRVRGPRSIRHRNRAVTLTDYEWIVQEASLKIAKVKGLDVTNPQKQFKPGWVTIMIVPHSTDAKPLPTVELIEEVSTYLTQKAPSGLTEMIPVKQIHLIPPNYLRVDVDIDVVVRSIGDAKEAEIQVRDRLEEFLHPLKGGPDKSGWEFGRDVYKTEIYEAIEKINTVDYVRDIALAASEQIYTVEPQVALYTFTPFPEQSRVHFRDNRIGLSLAEALSGENTSPKFRVIGFMEGDHIELNYLDESLGIENRLRLIVTAVGGLHGQTLSCAPVNVEADFPAEKTRVTTYLKPEALMVRSYLTSAIQRDIELTEITVAVPSIQDLFKVTHRDWRSTTVDGTVKNISADIETVYLEKDYLIYSGNHNISIAASDSEPNNEESGKLETEPTAGGVTETDLYRYLINTRTREVHNLATLTPRCGVTLIKENHKFFLRSLDDIDDALKRGAFDFCAWCFGKDKSNY